MVLIDSLALCFSRPMGYTRYFELVRTAVVDSPSLLPALRQAVVLALVWMWTTTLSVVLLPISIVYLVLFKIVCFNISIPGTDSGGHIPATDVARNYSALRIQGWAPRPFFGTILVPRFGFLV